MTVDHLEVTNQKRENQFTSIKRTESAKLSVRSDIIDYMIVAHHQDLLYIEYGFQEYERRPERNHI